MMRKTIIAIMVLLFVFSIGCATKHRNLRLDWDDDVQGLVGPEIESDAMQLDKRVNELWTELTTQKLTAYITKRKISEYFRDGTDLSEFIAIYASLFREMKFDREIVRKYKVNKITIEPNGVIALVDITIKGRIYFVWQARLHEVQRWIKSGGAWYLEPIAY